MTTRIEGFGQLLRFFRSATTWVVAGIAAAPLFAALARVAPPWPPGIAVITALIQLVVLALVFMIFFQRRVAGIRGIAFGVGLVLMLVTGSIYLRDFYTYTYEVPTTHERLAKGTRCTPNALLVYGAECPNVSDESIKQAQYEATIIWEKSSINAIQLRLVALWIAAFATLAWTLGVFYTYLMEDGRMVYRRGGGRSHRYEPRSRGTPAPEPPLAGRDLAPEPDLELDPQPAPEPQTRWSLEPDHARHDDSADLADYAESEDEDDADEVADAYPEPSAAAAEPPEELAIEAPELPPQFSSIELPQDHGKLLGNDAPGVTPVIAAPPEPPARWINAQLEDHEPDNPILVGTTYTLAIGIDAKIKSNLGAQGSVPFVAPLTAEEYSLTVHLESTDFELGEQTARPLRILPNGLSAGRARFDITPLHDGPGTLTATILKDGNFVQEMKITLAVGAGQISAVQLQRRGRPLTALAQLRKRDLTITVDRAAGIGFDCRYWSATQGKAKLALSVEELADAIEQLRVALMAVVTREDEAGGNPFQDAIDIPPAETDLALLGLATAGYRLYRLLFFHPGADLQSQEMGHWLRKQALNKKTVLNLQIIGADFAVPWALLYLAEDWDESALDWESFLGMRHIVEQIPLQNDMQTADCAIEESPNGLTVSVNLNMGIDAQMGMNVVQRQRDYWDHVVTTKPTVRLTTRTNSGQLLTALGDPSTEDQILYLYCHANAVALGQSGGPAASSLTLTANQPLTLGDLNLKASTDHKLKGNPFVFLNACESAELSPLFYNGFVPYFMSKGARGVLGTECKMPALFAVEWADRFFEEFLAGKLIGEIVLDLRREFLAKHGNPLGLLYGLHCNADTQVITN